VTSLGEMVLVMIRTRTDLHRWTAANAHGRQMREAVDLLRRAAADEPTGLLPVVEKAIAAAVRVIVRADDSSGIIGGAIRDLLALHADLACRTKPPASKLVDWLVKLQFDGTQDFFHIDIADYAPALGQKGLALYRAKLAEIEAGLGPEPTEEQERAYFEGRFDDRDGWRKLAERRHNRFTLHYNAQRLAVVDRDASAVIATHVRDGKAVWLHDAAIGSRRRCLLVRPTHHASTRARGGRSVGGLSPLAVVIHGGAPAARRRRRLARPPRRGALDACGVAA
jgi:hypothetical protein